MGGLGGTPYRAPTTPYITKWCCADADVQHTAPMTRWGAETRDNLREKPTLRTHKPPPCAAVAHVVLATAHREGESTPRTPALVSTLTLLLSQHDLAACPTFDSWIPTAGTEQNSRYEYLARRPRSGE